MNSIPTTRVLLDNCKPPEPKPGVLHCQVFPNSSCCFIRVNSEQNRASFMKTPIQIVLNPSKSANALFPLDNIGIYQQKQFKLLVLQNLLLCLCPVMDAGLSALLSNFRIFFVMDGYISIPEYLLLLHLNIDLCIFEYII